MLYEIGNASLIEGDSREVLRRFAADRFDACVCDPPYELTAARRTAPAPLGAGPFSRHRVGVNGDNAPVGGFMGKEWDGTGIAFDVEFWREVLRVLKPGAHLLAFGGTRTYHRMTCAIEDAGFEVRDSLHWLYGTGFPKSLDVSKAIDATAGERQPIVREGATGKGAVSVNAFGGGLNVNFAPRPKTAPVTAAAAWHGWGTALKPGHEPVVLARKPLVGTVAENVLRYGTGALNIDACRLVVEDDDYERNCSGERGHGGTRTADETGSTSLRPGGGRAAAGRWPANVLLDADAARELDAQAPATGARARVTGQEPSAAATGNVWNLRERVEGAFHDDGLAGASRFFYVAKPTRRERDLGCAHLPARSGGEATDRVDGSAGTKSPRAGAGRTGGARNHHPTVKPVELLRYLVRLVTPPGGTVIDPFTGSGTTGMAALLENRLFVGVEREAEYAAIAAARIAAFREAA